MAETEAAQDAGRPDTVVLAHKFFRQSRDHSSEWRNEAHDWYAMVSGEQWEADALAKLKDQQRPAVVFNRILRTINAIVGTQVSNRQETRYKPRELGDVQVNEILTAAAEWARDNAAAEDAVELGDADLAEDPEGDLVPLSDAPRLRIPLEISAGEAHLVVVRRDHRHLVLEIVRLEDDRQRLRLDGLPEPPGDGLCISPLDFVWVIGNEAAPVKAGRLLDEIPPGAHHSLPESLQTSAAR